MGKGAVYGDIKALNEDRKLPDFKYSDSECSAYDYSMVTMHLNVVFALWNAQDRLDY